MTGELQLRPAGDGDDVFLRRVYAEARAHEMALIGWGAPAVEVFLRMQFDAQHAHYRKYYPQARFDIVERAGIPLGRLYVQRTHDALHLIDIALLAQCRNQGIGSRLLRALQDEAACSARRVTLQVEQHNPARALYQRLGFIDTDHQGLYRPMAWRATPVHVPAKDNE